MLAGLLSRTLVLTFPSAGAGDLVATVPHPAANKAAKAIIAVKMTVDFLLIGGAILMILSKRFVYKGTTNRFKYGRIYFA